MKVSFSNYIFLSTKNNYQNTNKSNKPVQQAADCVFLPNYKQYLNYIVSFKSNDSNKDINNLPGDFINAISDNNQKKQKRFWNV